jgi:acyl-CoA thioesterase-1
MTGVRVCFIGDSYVAGVGDEAALGWVGRVVSRVVSRARVDGVDLTGYNLGVRRETSLDVERRFLAEVTPRLRDAIGLGVVLAVGINDTGIEDGVRRVEQADTLAALERIISHSAERGWSLLVVGPALIADRDQNERIAWLSAALHCHCDQRGIAFVEVADELQDDASWWSEVDGVDGAHPTAIGYTRLTELIWPQFSRWLGRLAKEN